MRRVAGRQLTQTDTSARRRVLCNSFKQTSLSVGETLSQSHPDVSCAMSAWGHLQTCPAQEGMSASPPRADIPNAMWNVSYGPRTDSCIAANSIRYFQFVGAGVTLLG